MQSSRLHTLAGRHGLFLTCTLLVFVHHISTQCCNCRSFRRHHSVLITSPRSGTLQLNCKPCIPASAEVLTSHACVGVLIGADAISANTYQQPQLKELDESSASQSTSAQLGFQGSLRRLLGGSPRQLAAADDEEDESYDDDLDIDEPLTAGQANPFLPLPMCFLHFRRIPLDSVPQLILCVEKLSCRALSLDRRCRSVTEEEQSRSMWLHKKAHPCKGDCRRNMRVSNTKGCIIHLQRMLRMKMERRGMRSPQLLQARQERRRRSARRSSSRWVLLCSPEGGCACLPGKPPSTIRCSGRSSRALSECTSGCHGCEGGRFTGGQPGCSL